MPEIKNTFLGGKMNKDLDERLLPKNQMRDALNIEVSTSQGDDVGSLQNSWGNTSHSNLSKVIRLNLFKTNCSASNKASSISLLIAFSIEQFVCLSDRPILNKLISPKE